MHAARVRWRKWRPQARSERRERLAQIFAFVHVRLDPVDGTRASKTKEAILDATDRLLVEGGFRQMTMDDIAREAGCSRRAVYSHFPSKEEVRLCSIDRVIERVHARLASIAAGAGSPAARLRRMLVERVLHRIDSVRPYRRSLDEVFEAVRPAYLVRRRMHLAREAALLGPVLEEGRARGELAFDDTAATATTLIRATNAFLPYSLSADELGKRAQLAADVARMADLLLAGLSREQSVPRKRSAAASKRRRTTKRKTLKW